MEGMCRRVEVGDEGERRRREVEDYTGRTRQENVICSVSDECIV